MCLALNMAKMANKGFSRAAIEEAQHLMTTLCAEVRTGKMLEVEFLGHRKLKAAIEPRPAMIHNHHTDGCLLCQNDTTKNP
jgi:hypothetical protein